MTRPDPAAARRRRRLYAAVRKLVESGMSQRAVARELGINPRTVARAIAGGDARTSSVGKMPAARLGEYAALIDAILATGERSPAVVRRLLVVKYGLDADVPDSTVRGYVARRVRSLPRVRKRVAGELFDSSTGNMEWFTPQSLFAAIGLEYDLDACAPGRDGVCSSPHVTTPAARFITPDQDALAAITDWGSGRVWLNPPYGALLPRFLERAVRCALDGGSVLALLPSRTDSAWFAELVMREAVAVCFLRSRVRFVTPAGEQGGSPAFGSVLVAYGDDEEMLAAVERSELGTVVMLRNERRSPSALFALEPNNGEEAA